MADLAYIPYFPKNDLTKKASGSREVERGSEGSLGPYVKGGGESGGVSQKPARNPNLVIASGSKKGIHHKRNEDRFIAETYSADSSHVLDAIVGVFDGHGGDTCSDFVSNIIGARLGACFQTDKAWDDYEEVVKDVFESIDKEFCTAAARSRNFSGSCATICAIRQDELLVANIGDCKALLVPIKKNHKKSIFSSKIGSSSSFGKPVELTVDHRASGPAETQRIKAAGGEVAHGRVFSLEPSRSFGDIDVKHVTSNSHEIVIAKPDIDRVYIKNMSGMDGRPVEETDSHVRPFLVVASDGVWDDLSNDEVAAIVKTGLKRKKSPQKIVDYIIEKAKLKGSEDDISAVLVLF